MPVGHAEASTSLGSFYARLMPTPRPERFLDRRRWDQRTGEMVAPPLGERFPAYLRLFGIGLIGIVVVGLAVFAFSSARLEHAIGYTAIFTGTTLLLTGGARGGGYGNIAVGAFGSMFGGRPSDENGMSGEGEGRRPRDPRERLRKGLRPPPNPAAFWQVVAGLLYIAFGIPFTL